MRLKQPGATGPIKTVKSVRPDEWRGLTSMNPGVITPLAFFPILREDRVRGSMVVQVKSDETLHVIVNPVRVNVAAYLIPKTALARFGGSMEVLNRSYMDQPADAGFGTTPKWFVKDANPDTLENTGYPIFDVLGIHYKTGSAMPQFNSDLCESYNLLVNWMRKNVSLGLPQVALTTKTLAAAFWDNYRFGYIKPSFDAEQMEGAVPVGIDGRVPVRNVYALQQDDITGNIANRDGTTAASSTSMRSAVVDMASYNINNPGDTGPYVDLSVANSTISLANIASARQTQAFAAMRDRYKSIPDEYLIDLLMRGISIPEADLRQPILLGEAEAVLGQTERYATDGANLDASVANGVAQLSFTINTPPVNTGGLVLVVASIVPEQLYERMKDNALGFTFGTKEDVLTPDYLADYLDPQKVETVSNGYADVFHSEPDDVFGYAPLNFRWRRSFSRVGGKFKRPVVDAFVEDRQRIWSVETVDPTLSEDFYLCPVPFPKAVFADTTSDPYEVIVIGKMQMVGTTVFGPEFEEDMDSYDEVMAQVDMTREQSLPPGTPISAQGLAASASDETVQLEASE